MPSSGEWPLAVRAGVGRLLARYGVDLAVEDTYLCRIERDQITDCIDKSGAISDLPASLVPLAARVIERDSLLMIDDLATDSVVADGTNGQLVGSFLGVGAFNEAGILVGILLARGTASRSWTNQDLERAGDTAQMVASLLIVDELRLHAESRVHAEARSRELRLQMHTISARSASASSLPELGQILVVETPALVEATWAIVGIRHVEEPQWHVHVSPDQSARFEALLAASDPLADKLFDHVTTLGVDRSEITTDTFASWPAVRSELGADDTFRVVGASLATTDYLSMVLLCGFTSTESSLQVDYVFDEMLVDIRSAVERTASAQRQIQAASELQHSLLPPRIPDLEGFDIGRLYKSAADHTRVGGDWYDIVQIDSVTTGFVVGDVAGHDIRSAALMGQLRHVLASQLRDRRRPSGALLATDRYFADLAENVMATAVVVVVDQSTRVAHVGLAGHPPPVIMSGGQASLLHAKPGPPIGFGYGGYSDTTVTLLENDTFIAYTDGVVENRTGNMAVLLDEFVAALGAATATNVHELVSVLDQRSQLGELVDDVAALVVQIY